MSEGDGGLFFFSFVLFFNNLCYGTVLSCSVLCSFCWILFWMCNLFNLYLLVLFHLLKVFVSGYMCVLVLSFFCGSKTYQSVPFLHRHSKQHLNPINVRLIKQQLHGNTCSGGKNEDTKRFNARSRLFLFSLKPGLMALCCSTCQNLWEMLFTSLCSCAPNNNSKMRQSNPSRGKKLCMCTNKDQTPNDTEFCEGRTSLEYIYSL